MYRLLSLVALLHVLVSGISLAQTQEADLTEVEHMRNRELAQTEQLIAVAPMQALDGWDADLLLVNRSWKDVDIDVDVVDADGHSEPLTRLSAPSRRHKTFSLQRANHESRSAALRIRYHALPNALQAHVV